MPSDNARTPDVRWQRLPCFADDPDVKAEYAMLLEHGRLLLAARHDFDEHRERSAEVRQAAAEGWLALYGDAELELDSKRFRIIGNTGYADRFRAAGALYRRAAEDGLRLCDLDRDRRNFTDVGKTRLALDGPLREDDLDPKAGWRPDAEKLYRSILERGDGRHGFGGPTAYGEHLTDTRGRSVLLEVLQEIAAVDGFGVEEERIDDICMDYRLVPRRHATHSSG